MIKETSLKIFLTSGVTLTVKENETIQYAELEEKPSLHELGVKINDSIKNKENVVFNVIIPHKYTNEKGKEKTQEVKHYYNIPYDRISWFMLEEV